MKIFLILFFVLFSPGNEILYAQKVKTDDPLNGPKKEHYANGTVCKEYILDHGQISGAYKFYSEKGFLVSDQNYVNGIAQGYLKTYFESGQLQSETNFEEGLPKGPAKEYFENGKLKKESNLTGEPFKLSGKSTLYYEDGKLWQEITVSEGQLVYSVSYDKEGRVTSEERPGQNITYWYENGGKKHTVINGVEQK